mmetsp:Transcript_22019/g.61624  ORF Transcript_22019/g.61624 Transcript_22019/m.61624 type:complete len:207 (-) Transcript_22019:380-1000(-)
MSAHACINPPRLAAARRASSTRTSGSRDSPGRCIFTNAANATCVSTTASIARSAESSAARLRRPKNQRLANSPTMSATSLAGLSTSSSLFNIKLARQSLYKSSTSATLRTLWPSARCASSCAITATTSSRVSWVRMPWERTTNPRLPHCPLATVDPAQAKSTASPLRKRSGHGSRPKSSQILCSASCSQFEGPTRRPRSASKPKRR